MASQDLQWLLVRNNSSFIVKQKGIGRIFSREPRNLVQLHSYKVRWSPLLQLQACQFIDLERIYRQTASV